MTAEPPRKNVVPIRPLGDDEIELILADIVRQKGASASSKIQALRMLLEMRKRVPPAAGENPFDDLVAPDPLRDLDDFAPRRRGRPKKPPA